MKGSKLFGSKELVFVTDLALLKIRKGKLEPIETIFAGKKPGVWYARLREPNPENFCVIFNRIQRRIWEIKKTVIGSADYKYLCR